MMSQNIRLEVVATLDPSGHAAAQDLDEDVVAVQGNTPKRGLGDIEKDHVQARPSSQFCPRAMMGWPTLGLITGL